MVSEAAERLSAQVISPVLFEQGVNYLIDKGENEFVEIGYGRGALHDDEAHLERGRSCARGNARAIR